MVDYAIDPSLPPGLPDDGRGTVITVGTFDGVHRGHWAVLQEIRRRARESGRRSVLVTFHPHPLKIVRPDQAPLLLTTPAEKKEILAETGLDYAVFLSFNHVLAAYSPRRFVEEILLGRLGVQELGHRVRPRVRARTFRGRGNAATHRGRAGIRRGRGVSHQVGGRPRFLQPDQEGPSGRETSRSAREGLGRPYCMRGLVVRGDGRGRKLGFPTANLFVPLNGKLIPPPGVYAVRGGASGEGCSTGPSTSGPDPPSPVPGPPSSFTSWISTVTSTGRRSGWSSFGTSGRSGRSPRRRPWWSNSSRMWRPPGPPWSE